MLMSNNNLFHYFCLQMTTGECVKKSRKPCSLRIDSSCVCSVLCRPRYSEDFRSMVPSVCWLFMPSTLSSPFLSFPLWLHHSTLSQVLALCSVHLVKTDARFSFFLSFLTIIMFPWCFIWLSLPGLLLVKNQLFFGCCCFLPNCFSRVHENFSVLRHL